MPTISESELAQEWDAVPCAQCDEFEGAIWLCGEGMICERCFAKLAGITEEDLFDAEEPTADFEVPQEYTARAKANLMKQRETEHGN